MDIHPQSLARDIIALTQTSKQTNKHTLAGRIYPSAQEHQIRTNAIPDVTLEYPTRHHDIVTTMQPHGPLPATAVETISNVIDLHQRPVGVVPLCISCSTATGPVVRDAEEGRGLGDVLCIDDAVVGEEVEVELQVMAGGWRESGGRRIGDGRGHSGRGHGNWSRNYKIKKYTHTETLSSAEFIVACIRGSA